MAMVHVFSIVLCWYACQGVFGVNTQCSTSTVKLNVKTHRNGTGHWVSQVGLVQDTQSNNGNISEPWEVNIEQRSNLCQNNEQSFETLLSLTPPQTFTLNVPKGVPPGYELFRGVGYYKFHTQTTATWPEALQVCAVEGAHLAIINSEKESDVMRTLFGRYPTILGASNNDWAWIGLQRIGDNYFTIFGDAVETTGFQRWGKTEPHKGTQYCGLVGRTEGALADHFCDWKVAFVCEYDKK